MNHFLFSFLCVFLSLLSHRVLSQEHASTPPRGWNSYDSFIWVISEQEFLQSAEIIKDRLLPNGYEYAVVDYLWYRRKVPGAGVKSLGFDVIDEWGRPIPDPDRWPSSRDGKGFTEVAAKVHSLGLKFGIHVMRGISTQAVNANTPILDITKGAAYEESGRKWTAQDIGMKDRTCAWMQDGFMSVNTQLGAGKAFLRSLYQQYAEWGVDFVKNDCVFGDDIDVPEITFISEVLKQLDHPILYSLSPGTSASPTMAKDVSGLVNMYRITGDDWDSWGDVLAHFDVARDFAAANMIGANGLLGKSWPDLDMLPLGWLSEPESNDGPHRMTNLNRDEQRTQMTLWAMAKSPLMFGGDVRKLDDDTLSVITNPTVLEINAFSSNNKELLPPQISSNFQVTASKNDHRLVHTRKSRRHLADAKTSDAHVLGLTGCADVKAANWSNEAVNQDSEQICWQAPRAPFCLKKREYLLQLYRDDEATGDEQKYEGKVNLLLAKQGSDLCLQASPERKLTSKERKRGFYSPCRWDANQMWELKPNGTLVNSYSGLCATVNSFKANRAANSQGVRTWIATGRKEEVYLAFFNLNDNWATITSKRSDFGEQLSLSYSFTGPCLALEEWSSVDLGSLEQGFSVKVAPHGVALIVLQQCRPGEVV